MNENETRNISRRDFLQKSVAAGTACATAFSSLPTFADSTAPVATSNLPEPRFDKLPRWKGFNLLEKFNLEWSNGPFREDDFQNIRDLGFNFVRLPMDYRTWIVDRDWRKFDERTLQEIDRAVDWGEKYGVHVQLNFHRAPGWTVASPPEEKSLWNDSEALDVCSLHWNRFAKRYQGIPNRNLSFNLFNEPANVDESDYLRAVSTVIDAIRDADRPRLIVCDGTEWGRKPFLPLAKFQVAQATRGYEPMQVSHYGASWVDSRDYPYPTWPIYRAQGLLASPQKTDIPELLKEPIRIDGSFRSSTRLRMKVGVVSSAAELVVFADGNEIFRRSFLPKDEIGEWKEVVFREQWQTYQNVYDRDYFASIPAGTRSIEIRNESGDWISLKELGVQPESLGAETRISLSDNWNPIRSTNLEFSEIDGVGTISGAEKLDREYLRQTMIEPWRDAEKLGIGVMVGEFGAYNKTPRDVVLRWFEDMLANWKEADWGFALWNFRGAIGVADSDRADVSYENWRGLKLDRSMLALLQKY